MAGMTEPVVAEIVEIDDDQPLCEMVVAHLLTGPRLCGRPAAAILRTHCPEHGTEYKGVCRRHLWQLRLLRHVPRLPLVLACTKCDRPMVWAQA